MEKSIESIWKEGFLKTDALVAPKLNDLYNQKSIHIIDKFKRMYTINRIAIVIFAMVILPISFVVNIPYLGITMFILFIGIVLMSTKFKNSLEKLDKGQDSYQYLNSFDQWIKHMITTNSKLSTYLYPYVFLSLFVGFWFGSIGGDVPGQELLNTYLQNHPDTYLIFGIPVIGIICMIVVLGLLAFFGERIGKWDINLVYGGLLNKLENLLSEMEELRA